MRLKVERTLKTHRKEKLMETTEETPSQSSEGQVSETENSASDSPNEIAGQVDEASPKQAEESTEQANPKEGAKSQDSQEVDVKRGRSKDSFDPNSLPDDLKPVYKSMQADMTKKYQAIAEKGKYADLGQKVAELSGKNPDALMQEVEALATQQKQVEAREPQTEAEQVAKSEELSKIQEKLDRLENLEQRVAINDDKAALDSFIAKNPDAKSFKKQLWKLGMKDTREYNELFEDYIKPAMTAGKASASEGISKAEQAAIQSTDGSDKESGEVDFSKMSVEEMEKHLPKADNYDDSGYE